MRSPTKNLDKSHLTDKERRHSIALIAFATLLVLTAGGVSLIFNVKGNIGIGVVGILLFVASLIIGFVWGYIGAMEDERSGGR